MSTKRYVAFARVSSEKQRKEGFSLDVQEELLKGWVAKSGGEIARLFSVAETASKNEARRVFREMVEYAKAHATELDALLFPQVDRAVRNLHDLALLNELKEDFGLKCYFVSQGVGNDTVEGDLIVTVLGAVAKMVVQQQMQKIDASTLRRAESGLFAGKAPYGYRNFRLNDRGLVETHPENGAKVTMIFATFVGVRHTLDSLQDRLYETGVEYTKHTPGFPRSTLYRILTNRAYIGEVEYRGQWYEGTHEPLVDKLTFQKVQVLLGEKVYRKHALVYSGGLITCGHCGHAITGERKVKKTAKGEKEYVYYRCSMYNTPGHPRVRVKEARLDEQIVSIFNGMKIADDEVREWFADTLRASTADAMKAKRKRLTELQRQQSLLAAKKDRLLEMRMAAEINATEFAAKSTELRDKEARNAALIEQCQRGRDEEADIALKAFELSQRLADTWVSADYAEKRVLLEIAFLNLTLDDVTLVPAIRKPFSLLAEGLVSVDGRGDWI